MTCEQTITIEIDVGCPPDCVADSGNPVPTTLLTPITPVQVATAGVTPANVVGNEASFSATPNIGSYAIRYSSGFFTSNVPSPPCPVAGVAEYTNYSGGFTLVTTTKGNLSGAISCPSAIVDVTTATLALNPLRSFNSVAGAIIKLWTDGSHFACCSAEDPRVGTINYGLWQTAQRIPLPLRMRDICNTDTLTGLGACPLCANATVEPVWDGSMPYVTDNISSITWYPDVGKTGFMNVNGKRIRILLTYNSGSPAFWDIFLTCTGGTGNVWRGRKYVGNTPDGTYMRWEPFPGYLMATTPDCIVLEAY